MILLVTASFLPLPPHLFQLVLPSCTATKQRHPPPHPHSPASDLLTLTWLLHHQNRDSLVTINDRKGSGEFMSAALGQIMIGMCHGSTCGVEGHSVRLQFEGGWWRWRERRREVFCEPGPAEQTGREQLVLSPVAVFAACRTGDLTSG